MAKGRLGFTATTIRRRDLKKKRPLTDEQLLAQAARDAEKWQERLRRERNT